MEPLHELAAIVHRESGILLRDGQHGALAAALDRIDPAADPARFLARATDPVDGPRTVSLLVDELTVKETYFLREAEQLERIPWRLLLEQARAAGRDKVRVWSAACATGEEPYSLALLAFETFAPEAPPVSILATDISSRALERAREGVYRPRSTRELDPALHARYFRADDELLVADAAVRSLVTFARHNLVRDPSPPLGEGPFDLILCRNVLIYFDGETVDRVTAALDGALAPEGTLLLGAADALCRDSGRLRALANAVDSTAPPARARNSTALRRPLGRLPALEPERVSGDVLTETSRVLASAPLHASAHFPHGLAELEARNAAAAVGALRRALYAEPGFGLAAFELGRATRRSATMTGRAARTSARFARSSPATSTSTRFSARSTSRT